MNGGADDELCVFHRGCDAEGCLDERGEFTVTGVENRLRFVGLITPDMPPTELMLG